MLSRPLATAPRWSVSPRSVHTEGGPYGFASVLIDAPDLDHDRASSLRAGSPRHLDRSRRRERPGTGHRLTQLPGDQQANLTPGRHSSHHARIVGATATAEKRSRNTFSSPVYVAL